MGRRARAALPSSAALVRPDGAGAAHPPLAVRRAASAPQALAGAAEGDALLLLADSYPWRLSPAPPRALLAQAAAKKLRLYAEYLEDLPSFNRSSPDGCLPRSALHGSSAVANVSTHVRSLCACADSSAPASTIRYTGRICGDSGAELLWTSMANLSPCADLCTSSHPCTCAWNTTGQSVAWRKQYTGTCGAAPTLVPTLPTRVCGAGGAPPAPPPPPPSVVTKTSWKLRAVVATASAASAGLARHSILLPQGSYTSGWW